MALITARVFVNGEEVYLQTSDIHKQFTVADLKEACVKYSIPCENGTFERNRTPLSDGTLINNGDRLSIHFKKGKDGIRG